MKKSAAKLKEAMKKHKFLSVLFFALLLAGIFIGIRINTRNIAYNDYRRQAQEVCDKYGFTGVSIKFSPDGGYKDYIYYRMVLIASTENTELALQFFRDMDTLSFSHKKGLLVKKFYLINGYEIQYFSGDAYETLYQNGKIIYEYTVPAQKTKTYSTPSTKNKGKSYTEDSDDPYGAKDYGDVEDFYDDHYDDFYDYEDAEDYYNERE